MLRFFKNRILQTRSMKSLFLSFAVILILVFGIGSTFAYVVTGTPTLVNVFLNGLDANGDLIIEKTMRHPYGDAYQVPDELTFTFEVDLGDAFANETFDSTQGEVKADPEGVLTVTVAPNVRTTVYDIPGGTEVLVSEVDLRTGFTVDTASQTVIIQRETKHVLSFTNTYNPNPADTSLLSVTGVKELMGREWQEGDSFTFSLDVYEDGAWSSLGTMNVTYELVEVIDSQTGEKSYLPKADFDAFDFSSLIQAYSFDQLGYYSFRVIEEEGSIGGVSYDATEARFDVVVTDVDMDGFLEISSIAAASENVTVQDQDVQISFKNQYAPEGSAAAVIKIQKQMEDTSGQDKGAEGYTFELYDEANKLIATSIPTNAAGETSMRLIYEPSDAGNSYDYILKETHAGKIMDGVSYDKTEYSLCVYIEDNLDGTMCVRFYDEETQSYIADSVNVCFTNIYDPEDAKVSLRGTKTLTGRALKAEEFSFSIYETDVDMTIASGAQPVEGALNSESGAIVFPSMVFSEVGTYYYTVIENVDTKKKGIIYDASTYLVTVHVADENGVLNADTTVTDVHGENTQIVFANTYKAEPTMFSLTGTKMLTGAMLEQNQFTFLLYETNEMYEKQNGAIRTAKNNQDGVFVFDEIALSDPGVYHFVVEEDISCEDESILYDTTTYKVAIVVSDHGDGQLVITNMEIMIDDENVDSIIFENIHSELPPGTSPPTGDKQIPEIVFGMGLLFSLLIGFSIKKKRIV